MTEIFFAFLCIFGGWQFASILDKKKTKEQKQAHTGKFIASILSIIIIKFLLG